MTEGVEGGNPPYFWEEFLGPYTNGVEGPCWLSQIFYAKKSMANYENKQHSLIKSRNQTKKTNLVISKSLVSDEIHHHKIKTRRGWARVEKLC